MEGKGTEKQPEMFMIYRNVIAATIVVTVCILAGSNAMAQRHGGFSGGGFRGGGSAFGRAGFKVEGFAVALTAMAFAVIGFAIAISVTGSSSLAILATHSFTTPIRITDTIPMDTILTSTDMIPTPNLFTKAVPNILTL